MVPPSPTLAAALALAAAALLRPGLALLVEQRPEAFGTFPRPEGASRATYTLNDGHEMPKIGFGTYRIPVGNGTYAAVSWALRTGYRLIDTAVHYFNEADVGRAVRDSGIPRSEIFVTTKLWLDQHGYERGIRAGTEANKRLDIDYIDLLLLHSPFGRRIVETYDAMLELRRTGIVRSVGVSNFAESHLKTLADYCRPTPVVNQLELHPLKFKSRASIVAYCKEHKILVQPYGSLLSGHKKLLALAADMAEKHHKTEAQVMLRWALDKGFQVIPKSTHRARIEENFDVFDFTLTPEEIKAMSNFKGSLMFEYWNPLLYPPFPGKAAKNCTKKAPPERSPGQ